ncbi:MAG: GNAT family N-acetyltransferase [Candidatus Micrarchaeota archaeon]
MLSIGATIRKAKLKDVPQIIKLWQELISCHRETCGYDEPLFRYGEGYLPIQTKWTEKCIRSRNSLVLVAEHEGKLVGYANAGIAKLPEILMHNREIHMNGIYLLPGFRRKGIGTKLFSEIAKWGKRRKIFSIGLVVSVHNKNAYKSYCKLGFDGHHIKMSRVI